jgi:predicted secreted protein
MPKRVAFKDSVKVDAVDLSNFARSVSFSSEHERVDVSGFNATGSSEFLAGVTTQSVTVEFYGAYGAAETHATLYPIHQGREIVDFEWLPDGSGVVGPTNPKLKGNVQILTYNPGATRGDADTYSVEFTAADPAGLAFVTA